MSAPKRVVITWYDITSHSGAWHSRKKIKPERDKCVSTGWLVYEDEDSLVLAQTWDASTKNAHALVTYPRGCCESIEYV